MPAPAAVVLEILTRDENLTFLPFKKKTNFRRVLVVEFSKNEFFDGNANLCHYVSLLALTHIDKSH